jgi:hypothetical protein
MMSKYKANRHRCRGVGRRIVINAAEDIVLALSPFFRTPLDDDVKT